jgi:tetratricopeptide (TPR) repeat protein
MGRRLGVSEDWLATGREREDEAAVLVDAEIAMRLDEREVAARLFAEGLEKAATKNDRARALAGLGQLAFREGRPREAIARLEEARAMWDDDLSMHPSSADTLGRAYAALDELEPAIEVFREALDGVEKREDSVEAVRFSVLMANAYIDTDNFAAAEKLLEHALDIAPDTRDPIFRARLYWSHSRLHALQNDPLRAARYARKALNLLELTEHTYYAALAHQLLAHIELDREHGEEALRLLEKGRELLADSGNPLERALFQLEEARALIQLSRHEEAGALAMEASGALADAHPVDAGRGYGLIAQVFEELGDLAKARELYELAVEKLHVSPSRYLLEVYSNLARVLEAEGRKDDALDVLKKAVAAQSEPSE